MTWHTQAWYTKSTERTNILGSLSPLPLRTLKEALEKDDVSLHVSEAGLFTTLGDEMNGHPDPSASALHCSG